MVLFLTQLKEYLEDEGVKTKYIKRGMLYCHGDEQYAKFKITVEDPEYTDTPYKVMKERTGQNIWGESFSSKGELAGFLLEKQESS